MLLIIAVLATLSAAFLLFRYTRRHDHEPLDQHSVSIDPPPNARPLFESSARELKQDADHEKARLIAKREYSAKAEARVAVDEALAIWRAEHNRANAAELLRATAENGLDGDFSRAAGEIIEVFREAGIDHLTNNDLAALLDSHISLLSVSERGSGAIFWLKQEVAKLRVLSDVETR